MKIEANNLCPCTAHRIRLGNAGSLYLHSWRMSYLSEQKSRRHWNNGNCMLLRLGGFQISPWRFGLRKCDVQHQDGPTHVVPMRCTQAKPFAEAFKKLESCSQIESLDTGSDRIERNFSQKHAWSRLKIRKYIWKRHTCRWRQPLVIDSFTCPGCQFTVAQVLYLFAIPSILFNRHQHVSVYGIRVA
jgi:hypothetical protein